jgi:hypothetical protein
MPLQQPCAACDRLWSAYEDAVRKHARTLAEYEVALEERDSTAITRLELAVRSAEAGRESASQALRDHEASEHSGQAHSP